MKDGYLTKHAEFPGGESEVEARLDDLFHAYREACPDPEPSVNFMPAMWAKIEARQASSYDIQPHG